MDLSFVSNFFDSFMKQRKNKLSLVELCAHEGIRILIKSEILQKFSADHIEKLEGHLDFWRQPWSACICPLAWVISENFPSAFQSRQTSGGKSEWYLTLMFTPIWEMATRGQNSDCPCYCHLQRRPILINALNWPTHVLVNFAGQGSAHLVSPRCKSTSDSGTKSMIFST